VQFACVPVEHADQGGPGHEGEDDGVDARIGSQAGARWLRGPTTTTTTTIRKRGDDCPPGTGSGHGHGHGGDIVRWCAARFIAFRDHLSGTGAIVMLAIALACTQLLTMSLRRRRRRGQPT